MARTFPGGREDRVRHVSTTESEGGTRFPPSKCIGPKTIFPLKKKERERERMFSMFMFLQCLF
jgi:hypothetical protein